MKMRKNHTTVTDGMSNCKFIIVSNYIAFNEVHHWRVDDLSCKNKLSDIGVWRVKPKKK